MIWRPYITRCGIRSAKFCMSVLFRRRTAGDGTAPMRTPFHILKQIAKLLFLCIAPLLLLVIFIAMAAADLINRLRLILLSSQPAPEVKGASDLPPRNASIVIPSWNGKDLLE